MKDFVKLTKFDNGLPIVLTTDNIDTISDAGEYRRVDYISNGHTVLYKVKESIDEIFSYMMVTKAIQTKTLI